VLDAVAALMELVRRVVDWLIGAMLAVGAVVWAVALVALAVGLVITVVQWIAALRRPSPTEAEGDETPLDNDWE